MTPRDDRFPDMPPSVQFDAAIEQALRGDAVGDDVATFARFVDDVWVMADRSPPPPSPALAALLAGSAATREAPSTAVPPPPRTRSRLHARLTQPTSRRSRSARIRLRVAAVPIVGKAAVLLAVATAATAGAAAGILPEPATQFVRRAIEVVTPFEMPGEDAARPGHAAQRMVDHPSAGRIDPDATAMPPAASRPAAIAAGAGDAHDPGVEANADTQPEPNPADEASSWAETYPEPDTSASPTTPSPPTSSPPQSKGPKKAATPDAGSTTEPGPKSGHVPPGHASASTPRPGGPGSGDAPLVDPDASTGRPGQPARKDRPAPSTGSSSNPARQRPHHGPPRGAGRGQDSNEEAPPSGPPPAAGHGPSAEGGRDHGQCDQSRAGAPRPADCAPGAQHDPGRRIHGDAGPAQAVDAPAPVPPRP